MFGLLEKEEGLSCRQAPSFPNQINHLWMTNDMLRKFNYMANEVCSLFFVGQLENVISVVEVA